MKNLFKSMMLVAVAAMGFTACSKDAAEEVNPAIESTYTMTFVADAPNTRTSVEIDGNVAKYSWSDGDVVAFIQSAVGVDQTNKTKSKSITIEDGKATFTTDFNAVAGASAYNYGAYYPNQDPPQDKTFNNVVISLASSQDLTEGTFDPNADLLMSKPILNVTEKNGHGGLLEFTRLAAVGMMNLKGVTAGETINKVVITFEEEVVNGNVTLDFEAVTATYAETGSNTVTLQNGALTALAGGTPIFFTCFPGEYSGAYSVEVTTNKATYTKEGNITSALPFVAGDVTTFNLTVGDRTEPDESGEVTIVASEQGIESGKEIGTLTAGPITVAFDKGSNNNAAKYYSTGEAFRVYGGNTFTVSSEKTILSIVLTFSSGEGTNAITTDVESYSNGTWTGSANSVTFTIGGTSGHRRIASMTITYGKADTREAQTLAFAADEYNVIYGEEFAEPELTGVQTTVSYASSNTEVATVNAETGAVTIKATGTTIITATAAENETYKAGSASYTLTVNPVPGEGEEGEGTLESPYNVAKALALINAGTNDENAEVYVKGTITSIDEVSTEYGNATYYIDNDLQVYRGLYLGNVKFTAEDQIQVDDEVVICGKLKLYNDIREINSGNYLVSIVRNGEPVLTDRNLAFSSETATATVGGSFTAPTLSGVTDGVVYSSSVESVATVDANTGAVTILTEGTTIITATAPKTEQYNADTATYTLTVSAAQAGGEGGETYQLLTDINNLKDGYTVIIAYTGGATAYAAGTQNSKYRNGTQITVSTDKSEITDIKEACEFTVTINANGKFAFTDGTSGNLYYKNSNNELYTGTGTTNQDYWTVTVDTNGEATIVNVANTARYLQCNPSSSYRFACYKTSSNQKNPSIYYKAN